MLYTSLYRLFKAKQIILYEISSIAIVNNELYGRQGKGRVKKEDVSILTHPHARGCISALAPCRTIGTGGLFLTHSLQGRYFIRSRIWKKCWRRIIRGNETSAKVRKKKNKVNITY